jgi:hypothetical protein
MRRAVLIPTLLMCAACGRTGGAITSRVTSDRPIADARTCALYRLQSLGYTIIESHSSTGSVEGAKEAAGPPKTTDRINVVITSNSDQVPVGRPNNTLTITVHTMDPAGHELTPSGAAQADGVNVSTACSKQ